MAKKGVYITDPCSSHFATYSAFLVNRVFYAIQSVHKAFEKGVPTRTGFRALTITFLSTLRFSVSFGRGSLQLDSGPVVEDSVPSSLRVCGYGPLDSSHVDLTMNPTELLGTPSVCASPFLSVDEPSSIRAT